MGVDADSVKPRGGVEKAYFGGPSRQIPGVPATFMAREQRGELPGVQNKEDAVLAGGHVDLRAPCAPRQGSAEGLHRVGGVIGGVAAVGTNDGGTRPATEGLGRPAGPLLGRQGGGGRRRAIVGVPTEAGVEEDGRRDEEEEGARDRCPASEEP